MSNILRGPAFSPLNPDGTLTPDRIVTHYSVPPDKEAEAVQDLTTDYHTMIVRGYTSAGRVHPTRFWRLNMIGDVDIFIGARNPVRRINASVALLWDFSSSQEGYAPALIHSLQVVGSSLQRNGVDVWAGAYTSEPNGTAIFEVNGWNDRWDHRRAATLASVHMDSTPTGTAMRYVRRFVLPRGKNNKKMLVVCTDGAPGDPEVTEYEIKACRSFGPVVGLYVGGDGQRRMSTLSDQFGERYAFDAPRREDIPQVFADILGRLRG